MKVAPVPATFPSMYLGSWRWIAWSQTNGIAMPTPDTQQHTTAHAPGTSRPGAYDQFRGDSYNRALLATLVVTRLGCMRHYYSQHYQPMAVQLWRNTGDSPAEKRACEPATCCLHSKRRCSPNEHHNGELFISATPASPSFISDAIAADTSYRGKNHQQQRQILSSPFPRYHLRCRVARRSTSGLQHLSTLFIKRGTKK